MPAPLPIPAFFNSEKVGEVWKVPYEKRAVEAQAWARQYNIHPAAQDSLKLALIAIDVQNTFCIPGFELYVGGRSGTGAVDDNRRLAEFVYRNLAMLTRITATMDTHEALQIFHAIFLVDERGEHPAPYTLVSAEDVEQGRWRFNPAIASSLHISPEYGQQHLLHYTLQLQERGKYDLTIWPYHALLGGIGHALVPAVEEAFFFHAITRNVQTEFKIKGENALTEAYSAVGPEVSSGPRGERLAGKDPGFLQMVMEFDAVVIAGQAKSHCVAWTVDDLLTAIRAEDEGLARKVYLLEDCSSPVVIPGAIDYTGDADRAYERFHQAGMHLVRSTDPIETWPGILLPVGGG